MIRIAICDDDVRDRSRLRELIDKYGELLSIEMEIREFESGEFFLESGYSAELLFLDIFMAQKDGIQVGAEIKKRSSDTIIIYVTNIGERMAEAINRIHSYGYLMKPVKEEELFKILQEAIRMINRNLRMISETFLSEYKGIVTVPIKDIYCFEYCDRRVKLVTKNEEYIVKEKIGDIAERMQKYSFEMSHQSFVVNLYAVKEIKGQMLVVMDALFIALVIMYLFQLLDAVAENKDLKYKLALCEAQARSNHNYYARQMEGYKEALAMIHDVRKHIRVIEELKKDGVQDEMEPIDITTIFGNLLDNAVEACKDSDEKRMHLTITPFNNFIYIQLCNTFTGSIKINAEGKPVTNKGEGHGIGLKNVEMALKRYNGEMQYFVQDSLFAIELMFNPS